MHSLNGTAAGTSGAASLVRRSGGGRDHREHPRRDGSRRRLPLAVERTLESRCHLDRRRDANTVVLFNGGLIAGGVIGLAFGYALLQAAGTRAEIAVLGLLGLTLASMSLVGVFPQGTAPHFPVAASFYLLLTVSLVADALVRARAGERTPGVVSAVAGITNIGTWVVWIAASTPWGLAVPEILGALAFGAWVCRRSVALAGSPAVTNR